MIQLFYAGMLHMKVLERRAPWNAVDGSELILECIWHIQEGPWNVIVYLQMPGMNILFCLDCTG